MTLTTAARDDFAQVTLTAARRLLTLGRDAEALRAFVVAATVPDIDTAALYEGTAQAMRNQGQLSEAVRLLDAGLMRFPGHASLRFIRSLMLLGLGQFAEGWPEYELRLKTPQRCYLPRAVNWQRLPRLITPETVMIIDPKPKLLIWSEQGFGDEIMFASLIPNLFDFCSEITFECSRDTAALFRRSFPDVRVFPVELNGAMPEALRGETFDHECPLGSLPLALGMERPSRPRAWLKPDPVLTASLHADLEASAKGRSIVGVSWRGGTQMTRALARSLEFKQLRPLFDSSDKILFVALQHDLKLSELDTVSGLEICTWPHLLRQLDSLAALIGACDEIVTVCGTNVHLAGAQGKRVRVLAPLTPEWRYAFKGEKMAWYPDVHVYRQETYGEWDSVIQRVARELS